MIVFKVKLKFKIVKKKLLTDDSRLTAIGNLKDLSDLKKTYLPNCYFCHPPVKSLNPCLMKS